MSKYAFKLYLKNEKNEIVIPKDIEAFDISDMDIYVESFDGYYHFLDQLVQESEISSIMVKKVTILDLKKNLEFSLVLHNPYLKPVFSHLQKKKMKGKGNYFVEQVVIPFNHPSYQEMKEYLFKNIENNYQKFLSTVYTYHNYFAQLLRFYGITYSQNFSNEEEKNYERKLQLEIEEKLQIYKNYRSLSLTRYRLEHSIQNTIPKRQPDLKVSNISISPKFLDSPIVIQPITQEQANQINSYVNNLDEEKEEFLEPDEIARFR